MEGISEQTREEIVDWAETCWNYKTGLETFKGLLNTLPEIDDNEITKRMINKFVEEKPLPKHGMAVAIIASILHWLDKEKK